MTNTGQPGLLQKYDRKYNKIICPGHHKVPSLDDVKMNLTKKINPLV